MWPPVPWPASPQEGVPNRSSFNHSREGYGPLPVLASLVGKGGRLPMFRYCNTCHPYYSYYFFIQIDHTELLGTYWAKIKTWHNRKKCVSVVDQHNAQYTGLIFPLSMLYWLSHSTLPQPFIIIALSQNVRLDQRRTSHLFCSSWKNELNQKSPNHPGSLHQHPATAIIKKLSWNLIKPTTWPFPSRTVRASIH